MSIETVRQYLKGATSIQFDLTRNANEVIITRRLHVRNISYSFRDFRADVSFQDIDYHKRVPVSPEVPLGPVSVRVGNRDNISNVRDKIIQKMPAIMSGTESDTTNTVKEQKRSVSSNMALMRNAIAKASKAANIRLNDVLLERISDLVNCYGNALKVPVVSFSPRESSIVMSLRWNNNRQSFTLSFSDSLSDEVLWGRPFIFISGRSSRDFCAPFMIINKMSEVAPLAYALGTPILDNQEAEIKLNPVTTEDIQSDDQSPRRRTRRRR